MDGLSNGILQLAVAAALTEAIEKAKVSQHPMLQWVSTKTSTVNRILSLVVAILSSLAMDVTWVVDPVTGLGTVAVAGIPTTVRGFINLGTTVFEQYWLQKGWYRVVVKPNKEISNGPERTW